MDLKEVFAAFDALPESQKSEVLKDAEKRGEKRGMSERGERRATVAVGTTVAS